jgi:hypothetical protein
MSLEILPQVKQLLFTIRTKQGPYFENVDNNDIDGESGACCAAV